VFDCAVEIVRRGVFVIHPDVAESVDNLLRDLQSQAQTGHPRTGSQPG